MESSNTDHSSGAQSRGLTKWLLAACLLAMSAQSAGTTEARVVCYYTNWSVYRPGTAKFNPQNINPYLCTHLIYAFGGFTKENTLKPFDKYQDIEKGGYAKFTGLKTYNQNLKTMIAIGGWNEGSTRFSPLVASSKRRSTLVKNTVKFMRQNKFDGLDLDWEYPSFRDGGKPKDRQNYAKLVQELREEFEKEAAATGRPRLLLTMAVPAGIEYIDKGYDVPKLNRYLDWMNILSYDYHSAFEPAVNHHSPLYPLEAASEYNYDSELNIDHTITHYLEAGADREKLVLGIPTYGRSFTLFNPDSTAIGAPADGPGEQGDATREKGYLAYYEICESLMKKTRSKRQADDDEDDEESEESDEDEDQEEWTVVQPNTNAMGPYAFKGNQWVGYDDIDIVRKKAEYVAQKGLGGIMFWSIDNDDFRGKCHGKPYPLIEAAKESLLKSLGLTENIPSKKPQPTRKRPRPSKPSKSGSEEEDKDLSKNTVRNTSSRRRQNLAKRGSSTASPRSESSTLDWRLNTPEPPTTPDPGSDFKCQEEGFYPHPRDCKKYFWCLDSGPSNLGIVAHQFTCPSGLYFNKAADSCDFSRNVPCKQKAVTVTTATTTTTTTRASTRAFTTSASRFTTTTSARPPSQLSSLFSTRRPAPRITAATSSTTFLSRASSTTPLPSAEEYEELEDELVEDGLRGLQDAEEDPKVIKELIDLIKKLGGVEQLEKHLAGSGTSTVAGSRTTTPATISRLLYERVLSQARPNGERAPPQQNSRGPQAAGLGGTDDGLGVRRERPQYTTINRQRTPSTTEEAEIDKSSEEDEDEDESSEEEESKPRRPVLSTSRPGLPQYVNIRRTRPTTTTGPEASRNALFERDSAEKTKDNDDKNKVQGFEYSTVRRGRPEAQETTSPIYKSIQRVRSTTLGSTINTEKDDDSENPTEAPTTTFSTKSSPDFPKYATLSRTQRPVTEPVETTTLTDGDNDVTDINDINVGIASPSFASENGIIKNADSSSVLNAQITTLSNIPKSKDESTNSLGANPVTYSTEITISEEPFSSTQKTSSLFAKRTRPTTTAKPQDITEQTTTAKVSFERKYANIKRTRLSASSNASSPLLRARLNNDILSDSGKEVLDDNSSDSILDETNESVIKDRVRPGVRKIRSTTPASQENLSDDKETEGNEGDYGSKRFVRPQSRLVSRRLRPVQNVQEEEAVSEQNKSPISSNGENGFLPRQRPFAPRNSAFAPRQSNLKFKIQGPTLSSRSSDDSEGSGNEFVDSTTNTPRPQPVRRFRPSAGSFESDFSSLTALDLSKRRNENSNPPIVTGIRNTQVNRRFRPSLSTTSTPIEDSLDSDSSVSPVITNKPRNLGFRGGRFTTARATSTINNSEDNRDSSETSGIPRARKIVRFSPRPFSRPTPSSIDVDESEESDTDIGENELNTEVYESKLLGKARLSAPVLQVSEENSRPTNSLKLPVPSGTPSSPINVTKVINSNILLGRTNDKSGILLLRRPSRPLSSTETSAEKTSDTIKVDDSLENIHLSESNIEEKEHDDDDSNTLVSDRPRKRIIVKKLRPTTASDSVTTESGIIESLPDIEIKKEADNNVDATDKNTDPNETGKPRIRKVLRRRPATSTTPLELTTTEKIETEDDDDKLNQSPSDKTTPIPRVRKIIRRKLKPVLTEEGKVHILETKNEESENLNTNDDSLKVTLEILSTPDSISSISQTTTESDNFDLLSEQTTFSTPTTKTKFDRPSYKPLKRPLSIVTTTEASTSTVKVYSRKYNSGPYTTPVLPSEREVVAAGERSRGETTRRTSFNGINKRVTTARTTTADDEDIEEEEDEVVENEDEKLVFVPLDQLFRREPSPGIQTTGKPPVTQDDSDIDELETGEGDYESDEKEEDVKTKVTPGVRLVNRPQKPSILVRGGLGNGREANRPPIFNRPSIAKPTTEESPKRVNRPVAFQPNSRLNRFGGSSTVSPLESTSKGYVRKYSANRPVSESTPTTEDIDVEAVNAKHKQLFGNPKKFSITTPAPSTSDSTTEQEVLVSTDIYSEDSTARSHDSESGTEVDAVNPTTEDSTTIDYMEIVDTTTDLSGLLEQTTIFDLVVGNTEQPDDVIASKSTEDSNTEKSTTEPHHVFAENVNNQSEKNEEDSTVYPTTGLESSSGTINKTEPLIKTSSQLDKLFSVSRIVEISSRQEKHRVNSKNESRLIEEGKIMQEKKPTLDKIGEVSRYTLIKIVEGDIPIYLTNLSHEYPVDNPPFNPIRIDEARNARALNIDTGSENLVASESVNAAYNHRNAFVEFIEAAVQAENQSLSVIKKENDVIIIESTTVHANESSSTPTTTTTTSTTSTTKSEPSSTTPIYSIPPVQYTFVPGAVDVDERKNRKVDVITPRSSESSTLALEALFKADDVSTFTGRQAGGISETPLVGAPQPFVVYAAPPVVTEAPKLSNDTVEESDDSRVANGRSITNYVKIQVLRPDEGKIESFAKGKEFLGVPAAAEIMMEKVNTSAPSPITISILNQTSDTAETQPPSTAEPIVISIANLDRVVLQKTGLVVNTSTTSIPISTETIGVPQTSTTDVTTTATTEAVTNAEVVNNTEEALTDSKISLLNIKPVSLTNGTLSKNAKKRPKLTFPRRYQSPQSKSSNITRISATSLANQNTRNRTTNLSLDSKNVPFTTPKYNRTNSYTSGRSRFSGNRSQNVPVDTRKSKVETNKFKPNATEVVKVPTLDSNRKVTIRPLRPGLLRSSTFVPRRTTTASPKEPFDFTTPHNSPEVIADIPSSDNKLNSKLKTEDQQMSSKTESATETTARIKPTFFQRRPANRTSILTGSRRGTVPTTTEPGTTTEQSHRFASPGTVRRRPTYDRRRSTTSSPAEGRNATEAGGSTTPPARPTRVFVRKFYNPRSGANGTNSRGTPPSFTTASPNAETTSRRSFRIGLRRRPAQGPLATQTPTTTGVPIITTVTETSETEVPSTVISIKEHHDQESHSTIQQVQEKDSGEDGIFKKKVKIQKRPLFKNNQLIKADITSDEESGERPSGEKKYSSVIKEDHTLVQEEKNYDNTKRDDSKKNDVHDDVTADVAVVAHHLLSAPLPTIPSYARDDYRHSGHLSDIQFTRAYLMASSSSPIISPNDFISTTDYSNSRRVKFTVPTQSRRISTTVAPRIIYSSSVEPPVVRRRKPEKPKPFEKILPVTKVYRPVIDYEYYDDDDIRVVGKTPFEGKVIVHGTGGIQCLDQGNFPHPESCKKFISCAKMENGGVYGWAYTCPKGLSFDPVGGICNWSAGLGCYE